VRSESARKISDPEVLALLQKVLEPHSYIHNEAKTTLEYVRGGKMEAARADLINNVLPKTLEVISLLNQMEARFAVMAEENSEKIARTGAEFSSSVTSISFTVFIMCAVLAAVFCQMISNIVFFYENILDCIPFPLSVTDKKRRWTFINKPVEMFLGKKRSECLGQPCHNWGAAICNTPRCGINCLEQGQKQTGFSQAGLDFKVALSYLTNTRGKVVGHVECVEDVTAMVAQQKVEVEMARNLSGSVVDLSESISEIKKKTKENAELATRAAELASMMKQNADKGSVQMSEMINAVKEINQSSQNINNVIKVINDIAFQTNLLALNASVEAARVGEQGKGFAVVADEVRNLASRSATAANNSNAMIQESIARAELGVRIASETADSLANIVSGINDSNQIANEIASASNDQASSIEQVNQSIESMSQLVRRVDRELEHQII
jgi:methyl-accepting chemotaxis protein